MSTAKQVAGAHAAGLVRTGMQLGLGTGSTVRYFLETLAERVEAERLEVCGVPTSEQTAALAEELRIPLVGLDQVRSLDLTVDGADEIDGEFRMIKGGGGALLREKVVASITTRQVIIVDAAKAVERLGRGFDLPVEVVPFALPVVARVIEGLGGRPSQRGAPDYLTDNGNAILDVDFPDGIEDPETLEQTLCATPGVVECGLFIGLADVCIVGHDDGTVEERLRDA